MKTPKLKVNPRELKSDESDYALSHLLEFNKNNPIAYNGKWLKKGTLKELLAQIEEVE